MAYRGWVKNCLPPSQQLTVLSSPITKPTTKTMDALSPLIMWSQARLPLPPSSYLHCYIKQGAAKRLWELVVIWLFYCDLPLTIFMNSMLSSTQNLLWDIIAQIEIWPTTYTTPLGCSFQQGTSKNSDNWFGFAFFPGIMLSSSQLIGKNGEWKTL